MHTETVVLCNPNGQPTGTMAKSAVHHNSTPLHRAFSCYIFDERNRVLLTRRALGKRTWPGVWTNSVCGHPAPGEDDRAAIARRLDDELGIRVPSHTSITAVLPHFSYRATDASGIEENEICPVYSLTVEGDIELRANPDEVMQTLWWDFAAVRRSVEASPFLISPWVAMQLSQWPDTVPGTSAAAEGSP